VAASGRRPADGPVLVLSIRSGWIRSRIERPSCSVWSRKAYRRAPISRRSICSRFIEERFGFREAISPWPRRSASRPRSAFSGVMREWEVEVRVRTARWRAERVDGGGLRPDRQGETRVITRRSIKALIIKYRRPLVVVVQLGLVVLANQMAFQLRFDGSIPGLGARDHTADAAVAPAHPRHRLRAVPLYEGLWRYTGLWDLRNIIAAPWASSAIFYVFLALTFGLRGYPRSVFIVDAMLLGVHAGRDSPDPPALPQIRGRRSRSVLVYGAGDAGERIVREMWPAPVVRRSGHRLYR